MTNGLYGETKQNEFYASLEQSLADSKAEFIDRAYYKAFPHLTGIKVVEDKVLQKKGIDKILFIGEKQVFVDEKIRKTEKDYPDILLEEYSNEARKTIGWMGRDKYTDYISYIKFYQKKMYLLPFLLLQLAWRQNYFDWKNRFGVCLAKNYDCNTKKYLYTTTNIPVPIPVLYKSLWVCSQIIIPKEAK